MNISLFPLGLAVASVIAGCATTTITRWDNAGFHEEVYGWDTARDLDVVLANYADSLAGTGVYRQGSVFNIVAPKIRSFTVFVNDKAETKVGPYPALGALIELAETSRLQVNKAERSAKVRVVLSKFPYLEELRPGAMDPAPKARAIHINGNAFKERTAVILIGYTNDPDHFESGVADFEAFMGRLKWSHPRPLPVGAVF